VSGPGDAGRPARLVAAEDAVSAVLNLDDDALTEEEFRVLEDAEAILTRVRYREDAAR